MQINKVVIGLFSAVFFSAPSLYAGTPVWTFTPQTPTSISLLVGDTADIIYQVTNQSPKTHTLKMTNIVGVEPSGCTAPLGPQQSCTLTLTIHSNGLRGNVSGGPVLCEHGLPLECYQPSKADIMKVTLVPCTTWDFSCLLSKG